MKSEKRDFSLTPLTPELAEACGAMTFPAYRHLLSLQPTPRHPTEGDVQVIQPVGVVARRGETPLGLALAEVPLAGEAAPELLSLFVQPEARGQGEGTALIEALEDALRARGCRCLQAVYMTGQPSQPAVERILSKRGWEAPSTRTLSVRFTPEEAARTPWYRRMKLPDDYLIFPWSELTADEREELQRSNERSPWIAAGLEPWRHDRLGFDPVSSVGLRVRGQVVGWVVNHRVASDVVRFTCSFMRKDLSRHARILPLYTASIERLRGSGCRFCTFVVPVKYQGMVDFVRHRCARWVGFVGETRGSGKALG
jgi:GNAT superfamily N-acetyltransferase